MFSYIIHLIQRQNITQRGILVIKWKYKIFTSKWKHEIFSDFSMEVRNTRKEERKV